MNKIDKYDLTFYFSHHLFFRILFNTVIWGVNMALCMCTRKQPMQAEIKIYVDDGRNNEY